jgi:hypothetical protein
VGFNLPSSSTIVKPISSSDSIFLDEELSLEEIVEQGEGAREVIREGKNSRLNLFACPELIYSSLRYLRRKHKNLKTFSSVCRYVTKAGLMSIQKIEAIRAIEEQIRRSYLQGNELDRLRFIGQSYTFNNRLGFTKHPFSCYMWEWVHAGIVDVSHTLGLQPTRITMLALVFGLSRSVRWIPEDHRTKMLQEAEKFRKWVNKRVEDI